MAGGDISFGLTTQDLLSLDDGADTTVIQVGDSGTLEVPGGTMMLTADYSQAGDDLVLEGTDGTTVVIQDYFAVAESPSLVTSGGAQLDSSLVSRLANAGSPMQIAQEGAAVGEQPIGTVDTAEGEVFAIRADGTRVLLQAGDPVYQGDIMETGAGSMSVTFIDDSTFAVGEETRMVLDELVYDPSSQTGTSSFSVVQGVFSFVSGAIAKTGDDAMQVRTPVATIGIRGTQVAVRAAAEGEDNVITLLQEEGGITGEIIITNAAGTQILNQAFQTTTVSSFFVAPTEPIILPQAEVEQMFGNAISNLRASIQERAEERAQEEARQTTADEQSGDGGGEGEAGEGEGEGEGEAEAEAEAEASEGEGEEGGEETAEEEAEAAEEGGEEETAATESAESEAEAEAAEAEPAAESEAEAEVAEAETAAESEAEAEAAEAAPAADQAGDESPAEDGEAAAQVADAADDVGASAPGGDNGPQNLGGAVNDAVDQGFEDSQIEVANAAAEIAFQLALAEGVDPEQAALAAFQTALAGDVDLGALVETAAGGPGSAGSISPASRVTASAASVLPARARSRWRNSTQPRLTSTRAARRMGRTSPPTPDLWTWAVMMLAAEARAGSRRVRAQPRCHDPGVGRRGHGDPARHLRGGHRYRRFRVDHQRHHRGRARGR